VAAERGLRSHGAEGTLGHGVHDRGIIAAGGRSGIRTADCERARTHLTGRMRSRIVRRRGSSQFSTGSERGGWSALRAA
jgi:hypothetical protein